MEITVSVCRFSIYLGGKLTACSFHQDIKKGYGVILFQFHRELDPFVRCSRNSSSLSLSCCQMTKVSSTYLNQIFGLRLDVERAVFHKDVHNDR